MSKEKPIRGDNRNIRQVEKRFVSRVIDISRPDDLCQSGMNGSATGRTIDTPLTQACSRLVHFVRFENLHDEHFQAAVRAFGQPDYLHRLWDRRALREIDADDMIVFAKGDADQPFSPHNADDEAYAPPGQFWRVG